MHVAIKNIETHHIIVFFTFILYPFFHYTTPWQETQVKMNCVKVLERKENIYSGKHIS